MPRKGSTPPLAEIHGKTVTYLGAVGSIVGGVVGVVTFSLGWQFWLGVAGGFVLTAGVGALSYRRLLDLAYQSKYRKIIRKDEQLRELQLAGTKELAGPKLRVEDVYIDVKVLPKQPGDKDHPTYGPRPVDRGRRLKLDELLRHSDTGAFAVRGRPGDGKTTLLRATAIKLAEPWKPFRRPLPILILLPRHAEAIAEDRSIGLAEIALSEPWLNESPITVSQLEQWLQRRRVVVMLDGIDEVPEQFRQQVVEWVGSVRHKYRRGSLIVSGRSQGFDAAVLTHMGVLLDLCPLTWGQIRLFVQTVFAAARKSKFFQLRDRSAKPEDLLVQLIDSPQMSELAMTPLLLHIIIYRHLYLDGGMAANRAVLYEEFVNLLLHERRHAAGVGHSISDLGLDQKRSIMRELAFGLMGDNLRYFEPEPRIAKAMGDLGIDGDPRIVADDAIHHGLLVDIDRKHAAFAHLSFQEYLAAAHIKEGALESLLVDNIGNGWWYNTTLLWAAQADPNMLIAACQRNGGGDGWELAIRCANEAAARGFEIKSALSWLIEEFLEEDHAVGSVEHHIACSEVIRRNLQGIESLKNEALVCKKAVAVPLFRLHEKEERHVGTIASAHRGAVDDALLGLWPQEVRAFVKWLNTFDHHGFTYRLPTPKEARQIRQAGARKSERHGIWVRDEDGVRPQYPSGAIRGFNVSQAMIRNHLGNDWEIMCDRVGPLHGPGSLTFKKAARQMADSIGRLANAIEIAHESLQKYLSDQEVATAVVQVARELESNAETLLERCRFLMELYDGHGDLIEMLGVVRRMKAEFRLQPNAGLKSRHVYEVSESLDSAHRSFLEAYVAGFEDLKQRLSDRSGAPKSLKTAAAILLAPQAHRTRASGASFDSVPRYLADSIREPSGKFSVLPEELLVLFEEVKELVKRESRHRDGLVPANELIGMIDEALNAVEPILARQADLDEEIMATARLTISAAAVLMRAHAGSDAGLAPLWRCVEGLTVIQARTTDVLQPNEMIVLIREDR